MTMKRWLAYSAVVVMLAGCAPALKDLKPTLTGTDSGNIWFATAGSWPRASRLPVKTPASPSTRALIIASTMSAEESSTFRTSSTRPGARSRL